MAVTLDWLRCAPRVDLLEVGYLERTKILD
jgi:hypothetical protein